MKLGKDAREPWSPNDGDKDESVSEKPPKDLTETLGSSTGEVENAIAAGGWAGTDDATSTAPSDMIGLPKSEEEEPLHVINRDFDAAAEEEEQRQSDGFGSTD